jgi:hypothetical protein
MAYSRSGPTSAQHLWPDGVERGLAVPAGDQRFDDVQGQRHAVP